MKFYIQIEAFEDCWFNYFDNSPLSYETRERAVLYLTRFQARNPEFNLRIVEAT